MDVFEAARNPALFAIVRNGKDGAAHWGSELRGGLALGWNKIARWRGETRPQSTARHLGNDSQPLKLLTWGEGDGSRHVHPTSIRVYYVEQMVRAWDPELDTGESWDTCVEHNTTACNYIMLAWLYLFASRAACHITWILKQIPDDVANHILQFAVLPLYLPTSECPSSETKIRVGLRHPTHEIGAWSMVLAKS